MKDPALTLPLEFGPVPFMSYFRCAGKPQVQTANEPSFPLGSGYILSRCTSLNLLWLDLGTKHSSHLVKFRQTTWSHTVHKGVSLLENRNYQDQNFSSTKTEPETVPKILHQTTAGVCYGQWQHVNPSRGQQTPHNDNRIGNVLLFSMTLQTCIEHQITAIYLLNIITIKSSYSKLTISRKGGSSSNTTYFSHRQSFMGVLELLLHVL